MVAAVLGGVILTVAVIMIVILCRRNLACLRDDVKKSDQGDMITVKPKIVVDAAAAIDEKQKKTATSSSSTASSAADSAESASSATSSTSGSEGIPELKAAAAEAARQAAAAAAAAAASSNYVVQHPRASHFSSSSDYVDGLPRPFEVSFPPLFQGRKS